MTYRGTVRNGVVHLEGAPNLPEGTVVHVEPVDCQSQRQSIFEQLARLAGRAKDLPSDLARNHDHYIHGAPRK
jgi:hypothetical protein